MTSASAPAPPRAGGSEVTTAAGEAWEPASPPRPSFPVATRRLIGTLRRHRWLVGALLSVGLLSGAIATKFVRPDYTVRATVWISSETPLVGDGGPIQTRELLNADAWVELLKSYRVVDAVVLAHALFVQPRDEADSAAFTGFALAERFLPGKYQLRVHGRSGRYVLVANGIEVEAGTTGDSIGRMVGLRWAPAARTLLRGRSERTVAFTVATPRESSYELIRRLNTRLPERSNFLWLSLTDENPQKAAAILNTWSREYVTVAGELKKRNVVEFSTILRDQLQFAERTLRDSESALQRFRVQTITLPTENAPVAAGIELTQASAIDNYFLRKTEVDNLRHDREALEQLIARSAIDPAAAEGVLLIPSVMQGPAGASFQYAFDRLTKQRAELAAAQQVYTSEFKGVQALAGAVRALETVAIPDAMRQALETLRDREQRAARRVDSQTADLQQIPTRTIEEMRLRRRVAIAEQLYTSLQSRYAGASLAEASTAPDVSILDSAVAPLRPSTDTSLQVFGIALAASVVAAAALALLLDRLDGRVRYPEHVSHELGLPIIGAVPTVPRIPAGADSGAGSFQVVESIRSLRLTMLHALAEGPHTVAITSAGAGDGKSLLASNLALAFAEAGIRTILVDGDTRRGALHGTFDTAQQPGVLDYLANDAPIERILHPTTHPELSIVPRGSERRRAELLTSRALPRLVAELKTQSEVVILDTPSLAAGVDALAIATAATYAVMVFRLGQTERKLASAKLDVMDRLPIQLLGAVLNDVPPVGEFAYYSYVEPTETPDAPAVDARRGVASAS